MDSPVQKSNLRVFILIWNKAIQKITSQINGSWSVQNLSSNLEFRNATDSVIEKQLSVRVVSPGSPGINVKLVALAALSGVHQL